MLVVFSLIFVADTKLIFGYNPVATLNNMSHKYLTDIIQSNYRRIPIWIKYLARLRLGFSHLCYHKSKHDFLDAVDPLCSCSTTIENTVHYFFYCLNLSTARKNFLNEIAIVGRCITDRDEIKILQTFLC